MLREIFQPRSIEGILLVFAETSHDLAVRPSTTVATTLHHSIL